TWSVLTLAKFSLTVERTHKTLTLAAMRPISTFSTLSALLLVSPSHSFQLGWQVCRVSWTWPITS
ncbi:hypothetical protein DFQ26_002930, partial [Actinomortierella ambigua]